MICFTILFWTFASFLNLISAINGRLSEVRSEDDFNKVLSSCKSLGELSLRMCQFIFRGKSTPDLIQK